MNKKTDKILLITVIITAIFGIIMIYSASNIWAGYKFNDPLKYVKHQSLFFILGLITMFILSNIDYKMYYKHANKILLISLTLLILVLIPGIGIVRNGSRSWFGINSFSM